MGSIFAAIAVALCFVLGLPIRFIRSAREFWRRLWWLPLFLGAVGFVLMVASWLPPFRQTVHDYATDMQIQTFQPATALAQEQSRFISFSLDDIEAPRYCFRCGPVRFDRFCGQRQ
jgi:hypothetical protein